MKSTYAKRTPWGRLCALLLSVAVLASMLCLPASAQAAQAGTAYVRTQVIQVDGRNVTFQTYALKDSHGNETNYVKLRDVASVLNGTAAQFNVAWDGAINLQTKTAYTPDGSEMSTPFSGDQPYTVNTSPVKIDGTAAELEAITITDASGGYTYFKLRDLGKALGFGVDWDGKNIIITSSGNTSNPAQTTNNSQQKSMIASGISHSLALKEDGSVWAWGSNQSYQLGLGTDISECAEPTRIEGLTAVSVAAGYDFSVALSYDGSVYVWGAGMDETPVDTNLTGIVAIDAGQIDILALGSDGMVWQWMYGGKPRQVPGLSRIVNISSGGGHNLALTLDGQVYAWGNNNYGQLGDGTTTGTATPVQVTGLSDVVSIAAGNLHSLAVDTGGKVYAWGNNDYGELGDGSTVNHETPTLVAGLTNVVKVVGGYSHSMALTDKGEVYTWGYGEYGQMGNGTNDIATTAPVKLTTLSNVTDISAGIYHDMVVVEDGTLYTWGRNKDCQLGNGQTANENTPQPIINISTSK